VLAREHSVPVHVHNHLDSIDAGRAWRDTQQPPAPVQGDTDAPGAPLPGTTLDGTVSISRGRYLHFGADLVLEKPLAESAVTAAAADPNAVPAEQPVGPVRFRLDDSRRVRSNEVHYLDHPRFGIITIITPYEVPEEKTEQQTPPPAVAQ
jgi:hypothetical protein